MKMLLYSERKMKKENAIMGLFKGQGHSNLGIFLSSEKFKLKFLKVHKNLHMNWIIADNHLTGFTYEPFFHEDRRNYGDERQTREQRTFN